MRPASREGGPSARDCVALIRRATGVPAQELPLSRLRDEVAERAAATAFDLLPQDDHGNAMARRVGERVIALAEGVRA